jgi:hypothetical protein
VINQQILRSRGIGGEEQIHPRHVAVDNVAFKGSRGSIVNNGHGKPRMEGFERVDKIGYCAIRWRNTEKV